MKFKPVPVLRVALGVAAIGIGLHVAGWFGAGVVMLLVRDLFESEDASSSEGARP